MGEPTEQDIRWLCEILDIRPSRAVRLWHEAKHPDFDPEPVGIIPPPSQDADGRGGGAE